jgi:hypothetical protein
MSSFLIFLMATNSPVSITLQTRTSTKAPLPIIAILSNSFIEILFRLFLKILVTAFLNIRPPCAGQLF